MAGNKLGEGVNIEMDEPSSQSDLKGTKIGEISEFERELFGEDILTPSDDTKNGESPQKNRMGSDASESSADDDSFDQLLNNDTIQNFYNGKIVKAEVRVIKNSGLLVDFSYKSDGFIPSNELSHAIAESVKLGDCIHVMIDQLETKEGYSLLSEKSARSEMVWDTLFDTMQKKEVITVTIQKVHPKGYIAQFDAISGFLHKQDDLELSEGASVDVLIQNIDKRRKKVLFTSKGIEQIIKSREESVSFMKSIQAGDQLTGTVTGIKQFGIFVKVDSVEGLVHISELSLFRVNHPSEVVSIGDTVTVQVLSVDLEERRLSLSMKALQKDPWDTVETDFPLGATFESRIIRVTPFGAFVLVDGRVEGLLHISEIAYKRIADLDELFDGIEVVQCKILKVSKEEKKIGLTLKGVTDQNQELLSRIEQL